MKKTVLLYSFVLALIAFGKTAWAQNPITVTTETELIAAVQTNGAIIQFANPISTTSLLEIKDSKTITIDMKGFTLNRGCTSHGSQVIVVRNGSTLNLSNGTLTGGWGGNGGALDIETNTTVNLADVIVSGNKADDRGGGISNKGTLTITRGTITNNTSHDHDAPRGGGGLFNHEGATAMLTNVTFNGNKATVTGGGGICNYGTMTLDGCTITGNSCIMNGGGIWQGAGATLNLQGKITVTGNTSDGEATNNLFLKTNAVITVTGALTGSSIGVLMESNTGTFTSGYSSHNGYDPATIFTSDFPLVMGVSLVDNEAKMDYLSSFQYIECSWDDVNKQVVKNQKTLSNQIDWTISPYSDADYKVVTGGSGELGIGGTTNQLPEFFVVRGTVNRDVLRVNGTDVHLVLCDGANLNVNSIIVNAGYKLHIHSQSYGVSMGKLNANNNGHDENAAAIGGEDGVHDPWVAGPGLISIHGGSIYAKGGDRAAGIGGGSDACGGTIVIYGGHIRADGGDGAGIDGSAGAGIGGGNLQAGANVTLYDGTVYAYGGPDAAGIGSGNCGNNGDYSIHHGGYFTMYGGYVEAHGADNGAGIGGGECSEGPVVNIYGGTVKAYGGEDAAGIGSGYHFDTQLSSGTINISGGEVYAWGKDEGAGIGGGENAKGADVTITGGIVEAHAGMNETYYKAIGPGRDNEDYGTLELGDQMMVRYKIGNDWSEPVPANSNPPYGRKAGAWYHTEARIEPCNHNNATYTDTGSNLSVGCSYCLTGTMPYTFNANGNWNDENKWLSSLMPHDGNDVAVKADATIPSGCCAHVGDITIDGGSITIADGGQLIHNNAGVKATMQKDITGHGGDNENGWNFIASPMVTNMTPSATNGFLTEDYDLYYYDEPTHYWMNHKGSEHGHFDIEPKKGYLYASQANTTLGMTGTLQPSNDPVTISGLSHEASVLNGFNLVGNPFACNATITDGNGNPMSFYVIEGKHVVAYEGNEPIAPATGVMVQADADHESVTFTKVTPEEQAAQPNNGSLQIALAQANTRSNDRIDNAIVSFNEGVQLEKFHFGNDAKVYIPQGGKDYAIAFSDRAGEIPLNFKATENGTYTLSFTTNVISSEAKKSPLSELFSYLHLIDNKTGADIDLLAHAVPELVEGQAWDGASTLRQAQDSATSYTFTARTTDYASRFKLVFASKNEDGASTGSATFAYYNGSEWVIDGPSTGSGTCILQVIDVMGRILSSETISGSVNKAIDAAPGVYILKLNDKVQKIVIK